MYTGKQYKSGAGNKVSRQIECGGVKQKVKVRDGRNNESIAISLRGSLSSHSLCFNKNNAIQRYLGKPDSTIVCEANVNIKARDGKRGYKDYSEGHGGSDAQTSDFIIETFRAYGLENLANVQQAQNGNPPGQCAEPHAVADALKGINGIVRKNKYSSYIITSISVGPAKIAKLTKSFINQGRNKGDIMPRCQTCAQWVPENNVLDKYL